MSDERTAPDVLSAEAFAELLSGIQVYIGEHSVQEIEAAYATLLARNTALEEAAEIKAGAAGVWQRTSDIWMDRAEQAEGQLREARAEVVVLKKMLTTVSDRFPHDDESTNCLACEIVQLLFPAKEGGQP